MSPLHTCLTTRKPHALIVDCDTTAPHISQMNETTREPRQAMNLRMSTVQMATELHLTGGLRAPMQGDKLWSLGPVLDGRSVRQLTPRPIQDVAAIASGIGGTLFGGDEVTGMGTPLLSRVWTSLDGPGAGKPQAADKWRAIAGNATDAGADAYAELAGHMAFSLTAAGIRLRDASDHHHDQLMAALAEGKSSGSRFTNIPASDLQLAFHSVLSELASARDYLAKSLAITLGAPTRIDSLARLKDWLDASSRAHLRATPIVSDMLAAYDRASRDPWLHELTEDRNLFLHRQPMGRRGVGWLQYEERTHNGLTIPIVIMPLAGDDPFAPGADALLRFVRLHRQMTNLLDQAAEVAPHPASFPHFVAD